MLRKTIDKLRCGVSLTKGEMVAAMEQMMEGQVSDIQVASFLTAMSMKGETVEEVTAGAQVLREKACHIELGGLEAIDTCGTGGDGGGTYNISTAVAFVAAAAGVPVVKHGNRSVSSRCGSADVLEALGANIHITPREAEAMVRDIGICFVFAPAYHGTMRHVGKVRKELGFRTMFNMLGPLVNPAKVSGQVIGVFDERLTEKMAHVLRELGTKRALVVHGKDGLDELSVTTDSVVSELVGQKIHTYSISPEQYGMSRSKMEDIQGGDVNTNASIIKALFSGSKGSKRDILVLNAGAALYIGNQADSIEEGIKQAEYVLDNQLVLKKLDDFIQYSNRLKKSM